MKYEVLFVFIILIIENKIKSEGRKFRAKLDPSLKEIYFAGFAYRQTVGAFIKS